MPGVGQNKPPKWTTSECQNHNSLRSFPEEQICAEVVRQVGAQHPSLAMAMAGAIANESDEQGEQIGRMLTPEDFAFVNRVVLRVLAAFGIAKGEA